ncbi:MAG: 30S ribosomal protein S20 [Proteobacteria bacterium]|nr:30S ribosomal protein S20 [Pseudomonadota bacterium]
MANHKSALKRQRQDEKRRLRNRYHRGRMRTTIRAFRSAIEAGDMDTAATLLASAISLTDRAQTKGVIHKNTASRKISRLQAAYNAASAA